MLKGFKEFLMRGNVVDFAVAVVIGAAFTAVVTSLTTGIITPLVGAILGGTDFSKEVATINGVEFAWGTVVDAVINFVLVAAVIYFVVVVPMKHLQERRSSGDEDVPPDEVELLTEIRDLLKSRA